MNTKQQQRLEELKNRKQQPEILSESAYLAKTVQADAEIRRQQHNDLKQAIEDLAETLDIKVEINDLRPLVKQLDILSELPNSFSEIKRLAGKINQTITQEKTVKIEGFRDLWEMLVRQNNKIDKSSKEQADRTIEKFTDITEYIEQLNETLKQGQQPEDFKPVRIVIGGDGSRLDFLKQFPSGSRNGGGGGNLFVNGQPVTASNPIPVDITDIELTTTVEAWDIFNATSGDSSTALTNTAQSVRSSAGQVGGWYIYNPNSVATYVNFYNVASGSVTVGTTAQRMVVVIPPLAGANVEFTNGIDFSAAISISATTTGGGNTAPTTALEANILHKG